MVKYINLYYHSAKYEVNCARHRGNMDKSLTQPSKTGLPFSSAYGWNYTTIIPTNILVYKTKPYKRFLKYAITQLLVSIITSILTRTKDGHWCLDVLFQDMPSSKLMSRYFYNLSLGRMGHYEFERTTNQDRSANDHLYMKDICNQAMYRISSQLIIVQF